MQHSHSDLLTKEHKTDWPHSTRRLRTRCKSKKGWGYYNIDYLELRPATIRAPIAISPQLVRRPLAGSRTQHLNELHGEHLRR